ncbi:MAG: phosphopantothenoylcysteine decarboxylase [Bacteroidota bacterium]|nr:phosphopantothenoylcysteine decarboxylase [Bacteroidota bacterium]
MARILVTAGPTYERIDAVRFIGNRSSGKMGYAIAAELVSRGHEVTLVSGPSSLPIPKNLHFYRIESAQEMYDTVMQLWPKVDGAIKAAAVADYTPKITADHKIKKQEAKLTIELMPTMDILAAMGQEKRENQWLVGFALETDNALAYAKDKLRRKNLDFIVLNSLADAGAGFNVDTNKITVIDRDQNVTTFGVKPKSEGAQDICEIIQPFLR